MLCSVASTNSLPRTPHKGRFYMGLPPGLPPWAVQVTPHTPGSWGVGGDGTRPIVDTLASLSPSLTQRTMCTFSHEPPVPKSHLTWMRSQREGVSYYTRRHASYCYTAHRNTRREPFFFFENLNLFLELLHGLEVQGRQTYRHGLDLCHGAGLG